MLHGHCDLEPLLPSAHRRDMSQALERTIITALQKDPQRRFPDCRSFRDSLIEALDYTTPFQSPLGMRQHTPTSLPSLQAIADGKIPLPSSPMVAVSSSSEAPPAIFPHLAKLLAKTQPNPIHAGSQQANSDEAPTDPHHAHPRRYAGSAIPQPHSLEQRFELAQQMPEEAATVQAIPTFSMHEIAQMMASQGNSGISSEREAVSEEIPRTSYDVAQTGSLAETTGAPHSIYSQPTMRVSDELLATYAEDEQPTFAKGQTSPKRQQRHDVLLGMFGGLGLATILFLVLWFFLR